MTVSRLDLRSTPATPWHRHRWTTVDMLRAGSWMEPIRRGDRVETALSTLYGDRKLVRGTVTIRTRLCGCGAVKRWEMWPAGKRRVR